MPTFNNFTAKNILYWIVALVILGSALFLILGNRNDGEETLIIKKGNFLQQVSVSGKVISASTVDLAFSQTGRVGRVYADVGDKVFAGTILASVENADAWAEILQKEAALQIVEVELADLKRGSRPEKIAISEAKVFSAEVGVIDKTRSLSEKISDAYVKSDDAVRTKADQFFSNSKSLNPQLVFEIDGQLKQDVIQRRVLLENMLIVWSEEIEVNTDLNELTNTSLIYLASVKTFLEKAALALSSLGASSSLSQSTIDGWKSDISTARVTVSTATNALVSAVGDLSSANASLTLTEKELFLEKAGATKEDIEEQEAKIKVAQADLASARAKYQKTLIIAPFDGVVSKMDAKVGGLASSNTSVISMISVDQLQIESFVPEINAPFIKVGDKAVLTLDAYGPEVSFSAEVISIDPAETIRDGVSTYRAKLQFLNIDNRVTSGMTANIVITTKEKENVITIPQGIISSRDGKKFVWVKEGGLFVERAIQTGSVSSFGEVEITSGLNEGDIILLTPNKQ